MSKQYGQETQYWEAGPMQHSMAPPTTAVDTVVINGPVLEADPTSPWTAGTSSFWPRQLIQKDSQGDLLLLGNALGPIATWSEFLNESETLSSRLQMFRDKSKRPWVVLCHCLGGIMFLVALKRLRHRDPTSFPNNSMSIVMFSVPLDHTEKKFKDAIERSWNVAFDLAKDSHPELDKNTLKVITESISVLKDSDVNLVCCIETKKMRAGRWYKQLVVSRDVVMLDSSWRSIDFHKAHLDIAKLDGGDLNKLMTMLRDDRGKLQIPPVRNTILASMTQPLNSSQSSTSLTPASTLAVHNPLPQRRREDTSSAKPIFLPCHLSQLSANRFFVEREDIIDEIAKHLGPRVAAQNAPTASYAICGPPGRGKTQTAARYLQLNRDRFKATAWISADTENKLHGDMSKFAQKLGLVENSKDIQQDANILRDWLGTTHEPWLIIFDNAPDDHRLVTGNWIESRVGSILITSRSAIYKSTTVCGFGQMLPVMSEDLAISMLSKQIAQSVEGENREQAVQIVKLVDCLPLGIQLMITLLNEAHESGASLKDFNEQWAKPKDVFNEGNSRRLNLHFAPYHDGLLEVYFEVVKTLDNTSRALLNILSILDPDRLFISKLLDRAGAGNKAILGPVVSGKTKALADLTMKTLIQRNEESGKDFPIYNIHRLFQAFLQKQMETDLVSAHTAFSRASTLIACALTHVWDTNWPTIRVEFTDFFPHVQSIHDFYLELMKQGPHLHPIPLAFIQLTHKGASIAYRRNKLKDALALLEVMQEIFAKPDRSHIEGPPTAIIKEEIECYYSHACISTETADFEPALQNFQKASDLLERLRTQGASNISQEWANDMAFASLGGIANSLNGLGRYKESDIKYVECLEICTDEFSIYQVNYRRNQWAAGNWEGAAVGLEALVDAIEKRFGGSVIADAGVLAGSALYVLGNVRVSQGKLKDAFGLHNRALSCWRASYGEDHHKTGDAHHKIAWHHANDEKPRLERALDSVNQALVIYQSGSDKYFRQGEIARTTYLKSLILQNLGKKDEGKTALREARGKLEELRPSLKGKDLNEAVFDSIVSLWAR